MQNGSKTKNRCEFVRALISARTMSSRLGSSPKHNREVVAQPTQYDHEVVRGLVIPFTSQWLPLGLFHEYAAGSLTDVRASVYHIALATLEKRLPSPSNLHYEPTAKQDRFQ